MAQRIKDIAFRFLSGEDCSRRDLVDFKQWLTDPASALEVETWLQEQWVTSSEIDSSTLIETIFQQIQERPNLIRKGESSLTRILKIYQKIAAILLIPIIGFGIVFWLVKSNTTSGTLTLTIAPRGQKSQIVLSDGTKVWLNSDTKIKYSGNFDKDQRDVYLEGEAFFEVSKNAHWPFVVHTCGLDVKVMGTKFNVKAYSDENKVEASLFEGKIDLELYHPASDQAANIELKPGQSVVYSKESRILAPQLLQKEEIDGWKKNQLIFKNDTFYNLVKKLERWYDVKVIYDEKLFDDRRLTVELYEGEHLERLMEIVSLALSVNYKYEKGEIILTPKSKNM